MTFLEKNGVSNVQLGSIPLVNCYVKRYPNYLTYTLLHKANYESGWEDYEDSSPNKKGSSKSFDKISITQQERLYKVKSKIFDYAVCNDWDFFGTLTFARDKEIDSKSYLDIKDIVTKFLKSYKRKNQNFNYLLILEKHKSGDYHLHCLLKGINEKDIKIARYEDSGNIVYTKTSVGKKPVFHFLKWQYGFTNLIEIFGEKEKISGYMTKYITKDLEYVKNRTNYIVSRGLNVPQVEKMYLDSIEFERLAKVNQVDLLELKYCKKFTINI